MTDDKQPLQMPACIDPGAPVKNDLIKRAFLTDVHWARFEAYREYYASRRWKKRQGRRGEA